jgi:propanol-preferring alcohol dehydrogenase
MKMRAMRSPNPKLRLAELEIGAPAQGKCFCAFSPGGCRTDLHIADGELPRLERPAVPGHEIVGEVIERGAHVERFAVGQRVGVPWLGWTCGECGYCTSGRENLCDRARFTGYHMDGGYAEFALADARYCFALPESYPAEKPRRCSARA